MTVDSERISLTVTMTDPDSAKEHRIEAEKSVAAMAMHALAARDRARAAEDRMARLDEAVNGPLRKVVEQGPGAVGDLRRLLEEHRPLLDIDVSTSGYPSWLPTTTGESGPPRLDGARTFHGPPYDFSWAWHRLDGSPPSEVQIDRPSGQVVITAAAGPLAAGSGDKFVEAHAGFGIFFRANTNGTLIAESARRFEKVWYNLAAYGIGSWAVTDGGTEGTLLEEGQLKMIDPRTRWHDRVSVNEHREYESNLFGDGPMRFDMPVRAGLGYTFNVGVGLHVDNTSGLGQSGVITRVLGEMPTMETTFISA